MKAPAVPHHAPALERRLVEEAHHYLRLLADRIAATPRYSEIIQAIRIQLASELDETRRPLLEGVLGSFETGQAAGCLDMSAATAAKWLERLRRPPLRCVCSGGDYRCDFHRSGGAR